MGVSGLPRARYVAIQRVDRDSSPGAVLSMSVARIWSPTESLPPPFSRKSRMRELALLISGQCLSHSFAAVSSPKPLRAIYAMLPGRNRVALGDFKGVCGLLT